MPDDTTPIPDVHEAASSPDARTSLGRRLRGMSWFVGAALLGLAARGVHLQVVRGAEHAARLEAASVKRARLAPSRGVIRDARGRVVAEDRVAVDAYVVPDRMLARPEEAAALAAALGLDDAERGRLRQKLDAVPAAKRAQLLLVRRDVAPERLQAIRADGALSSIKLIERAGRRYPFGPLGAHAIGYMNEVSPADLANDPGKRPGDRVGRTGVERAQDRALRGTPGHVFEAATRRIVVPAGREGTAPIAGHDVTLTLDMDLARALNEAFDRHDQRKGAAVLIDVHTGRVLAMTSRPAFDPNLLDRGVAIPASDSELDRALLESEPPGSTIKPFTALAALASDRAAAEHSVACNGVYPLGRRLFRCTHTHGRVDLDHALVENCFVWFYDQAARLGLDAIVGEAKRFGLGAPTGIEMGRELAGLVPTRAWFEHADPGPFRAGHSLNAAIGLGAVRVTPIQLAVAYAALANGGTVRTPQIVVSDVPAPARQVDVPAADLARVLAALRTRAGKLDGLQAGVAGIAGASDSRELFLVPMADIEAEDGPPDDEPPARPVRMPGTNGWFAGFAPADAPEVAIVVLVQGRSFSSYRAATTIADDTLRAYFAGKERGSR